jgi:hypothetical protein
LLLDLFCEHAGNLIGHQLRESLDVLRALIDVMQVADVYDDLGVA